MTRLLISMTLRAYYSLISPTEAEPTEALVCWIGGCCDCSNVSTTGTQMCMGCSGASAAGDCATGETYVPCPPGTCFMYGGKFAYKPGQTSTPGACK